MAIVTHWYDWNWAAAEKEFKRAIELSPNNSEAHGYYSWFLAPMGRKDEGTRGSQASSASRSTLLDGEPFRRIGFGVYTTVGPGD